MTGVVVLVAYATEHGSTEGVADRIARRLRGGGVDAEVRPVAEVTGVGPYAAVVVGSAVHGGRWLPAGRRFVLDHAPSLRGVPVWLFSVSTLGDEEAMFPDAVATRLRRLRKETAEVAELRRAVAPRGHRNFAGALARGHWSRWGRLFFFVMGGRYGDHRNGAAIDRWAAEIVAELLGPGSRAGHRQEDG